MKKIINYCCSFLAIGCCILTMSCKENGQNKSVISPLPTIQSISPTTGKEGTMVTITGANFSTDATDVMVNFNGVEANEILFASDIQISTAVPAGVSSGKISVTVADQTVEGPVFTIERSFTAEPTVGSVGTEIILTGEGFSTIIAENTVRFNGVEAVVNSATQTTISTIVPVNSTDGPITVTVNEEIITQQGSGFTVTGILETPENFKVAFMGDTEIGAEADAVLNLIRNEGADAVVHAGDLDYVNNPQAFEDNINGILGENFPYFFSVGNHDDGVWNGVGGYQEFLEARYNRLGISWEGQLGVKGSFSYKGIFFVCSAPDEFGITPEEAGTYVRDQLANDDSQWRVSYWHKNQRLMQIGGKSDEAGWDIYDESRKGGAIMATGHEHSYCRTYEMSHFETQTISSTDNTVNLIRDDVSTTGIDEGRSFAFVSGLGGRGIRDNEDNLDANPWWADVFHLNNGAQYGALFGEFNYNGDASLARFYFKDVDGVERDVFFVRSHQ